MQQHTVHGHVREYSTLPQQVPTHTSAEFTVRCVGVVHSSACVHRPPQTRFGALLFLGAQAAFTQDEMPQRSEPEVVLWHLQLTVRRETPSVPMLDFVLHAVHHKLRGVSQNTDLLAGSDLETEIGFLAPLDPPEGHGKSTTSSC